MSDTPSSSLPTRTALPGPSSSGTIAASTADSTAESTADPIPPPDFSGFDFGGPLEPGPKEVRRRRQGIKERWNDGFKEIRKTCNGACNFWRKVDKKNDRTRKLKNGQANFYHDILNWPGLDKQTQLILYWRRTMLNRPPPEWVDATEVAKCMTRLRPEAVASHSSIYRAVNTNCLGMIEKNWPPRVPPRVKPRGEDGKELQDETPLPDVPSLFALWSYGDAARGFGTFPKEIKKKLQRLGLTWLVVEPWKRNIPECWQAWAAHHGLDRQDKGGSTSSSSEHEDHDMDTEDDSSGQTRSGNVRDAETGMLPHDAYPQRVEADEEVLMDEDDQEQQEQDNGDENAGDDDDNNNNNNGCAENEYNGGDSQVSDDHPSDTNSDSDPDDDDPNPTCCRRCKELEQVVLYLRDEVDRLDKWIGKQQDNCAMHVGEIELERDDITTRLKALEGQSKVTMELVAELDRRCRPCGKEDEEKEKAKATTSVIGKKRTHEEDEEGEEDEGRGEKRQRQEEQQQQQQQQPPAMC